VKNNKNRKVNNFYFKNNIFNFLYKKEEIMNKKVSRVFFIYLLTILCLLGIGLNTADAARELRLVSESDTTGVNTVDKYAQPGETCTIELWVETDTDINGVAAYLLYSADKVSLSDTEVTRDTTVFGDTPLVNTIYDYDGTSDTMTYAVLTTVDSFASGSMRVAVIQLVPGSSEDTIEIGFNFDSTNNKVSMITSVYAQDVLSTIDSGIIVIDGTPPVDTFTLTSLINGDSNEVGFVEFTWQETYDTLSGLAYWVIEFDTDLADSFNPSPYSYVTTDSSCTYTPGLLFTEDTWVWRVAAVDNAGNTSSWSNAETFVIYSPVGPAVYIDTPTSSEATNDSPYTVAGYTLNTLAADTIRISVNGTVQDTYFLDNTNGTYVFNSVTLATGWDTITIEAVDSQGIVLDSASVLVEFNDSVYLAIDTPVASGGMYDTSVTFLTIYGHTSDAEDGDSVGLYVDSVLQETITVSSGSWSGSITITGIGNNVVAYITDRFSNESYDTITVNYLNVDYIAPLTADTELTIDAGGIVGTDSTYTIALNNLDTVTVSLTNAVGGDTWTARFDPAETYGFITVKSIPSAIMNGSDTSRIRFFNFGWGASFQMDVYDSALNLKQDSYFSNDSPVLTFDYKDRGVKINPGLLRFYYLNTGDSVWYEASHPDSGAAPGVSHVLNPGQQRLQFITLVFRCGL
jgi:hypothetical protein